MPLGAESLEVEKSLFPSWVESEKSMLRQQRSASVRHCFFFSGKKIKNKDRISASSYPSHSEQGKCRALIGRSG